MNFLVVSFFILLQICSQNIYFPVMYSNYTYNPFNLDVYPSTFFSWHDDNKRVLQFYINDSFIYGLLSFSESLNDTCFLAKIDTKLLDRRCSLGNEVIDANKNYVITTLDCMRHSFVLLIELSLKCTWSLEQSASVREIGSYHSIIALSNFRQSQLLSISFYKNASKLFLLIWKKGYNKIGILRTNHNNLTKELQNKRLRFQWLNLNDIFNGTVLQVQDVKLGKDHVLFSLSNGCMFWCYLVNCNQAYNLEVLNCNSQSSSKYASLAVSESGDFALQIESFMEGLSVKQGTTTIATYHIKFNVLHLVKEKGFLRWKQCGLLGLSDLVFVYSKQYGRYRDYNPCKLDKHGKLLACLILGEPYILDIHDCNSAHPISSFSTSSLRLGYAISRFGFLTEDIFFYEIIINSNENHGQFSRGFVFDVKKELQPTLIASQIIYPTLATAITPAESFILVNHQDEDIYFFAHSGRIFYSKPIQEKFEIQLSYRSDLSFYVADILRMSNTTYSSTIPFSHNFEHPFAFFSPYYKMIVYLSYYQYFPYLTIRSISGSFSASAISVAFVNASYTQPKSVIQIGGQNILVQAGVDINERLLVLVYKSLIDGYFDVKITLLETMPAFSVGTEFVLVQNELPGRWDIQAGNPKESTRIWTIPFTSNNSFYLSSHNLKNFSTNITKCILKDDMTLERRIVFELPSCYAFSNLNDYLNWISIILCVVPHLDGSKEIGFKIVLVNFTDTWSIICEHHLGINFTIDSKPNYGIPIGKIPLFDYDSATNRLVLGIGNKIVVYSTNSCPLTKLYEYTNGNIISAVALLTMKISTKYFSVSLISYLQKLDAISDCTNGYGVISSNDKINSLCVRCIPGQFGLGCQACTPGFYCQGYSQLQPTGPCPEGYYCLEGTSFSFSNSELDLYRSTFVVPNPCPEGSYCPAGTATFREDDLTHNNPKPCLEGYFCSGGSKKPTQNSCPQNSISPSRSKALSDCQCKEGFYGDTVDTGLCVRCLQNGNCSTSNKNNSNLKYPLNIPPGYWPNIPSNTTELLKCDMSLTGNTPCTGGSCFLQCTKPFPRINLENETNFSCTTICTDVCLIGQSDRMCSKCNDYYYKHSSSVCKSCHLVLKQYVFFGIMSLICVSALFCYFTRKFDLLSFFTSKKLTKIEKKDYIISNEAILEIILGVTLLFVGASSATSMLFIFFATFVTYVQQLDSPPYTKNIFIFYVQTLQALTSGKFIWPDYMKILFTLFDIIYSPFPSIGCLPNIFTGKNLGWYGSFFIFFFLPIFLAILLIFIVWINYKIKKQILFQPIYSYLMLMSVLQFPLGSLSLSALACTFDKVTQRYYMQSEPWQQCHITSPVQLAGIMGTFLYLLGVPVLLHYWYWNSSFLDCVKTQIGDLILPAGCREDSFFLIFVTLRNIVLALVISVIPPYWNISTIIIFILLGLNIIIVLQRKPYLDYRQKYFNSSTIVGETLEVSSIFLILTSVIILESKSEYMSLSLKSLIVGSLNLLFSIYFLFGVIFSQRIKTSRIYNKLISIL